MKKNFLLVFFSIIIIVFSFVMPNLLLGAEDVAREKEIFIRQKKQNKKIDVQAEKIYLVTFIHDIYQIKDEKIYNVKTKSTSYSGPVTSRIEQESPTEKFKNEISKLISNEILNEINFDEYIDYLEVENYFPLDYIVRSCSMPKENGDFIEINVEQKTGKIISIYFSENFLRTDAEVEKQLRNYAKYLDLDIIDDWEFHNNILESEKAQLTIMLDKKENSYMLTIAPIDIYDEYVAEDTAFSHEYEIVESTKKK